MRLGKYLSSLTKPELEQLKLNLNLTDDEEIILNKLAKGHSVSKIQLECAMSESTILRRTDDINTKIMKCKELIELRKEIPIADKYNLTVDEAAAYFGIGTDKIREITNDNKNLVLMVGSKRLIKKKAMEKYLDGISVV